MKDRLEEYDLAIRESEANDRLPIDFSIEDLNDNVAWVWGQNPRDVEIECDHPEECIEWGDDDERGECAICGAQCDWHYEERIVSEGHDEDGNYTCQVAKVRVHHEWHRPDKTSGIIKQILDELGEYDGKAV